LKLRSTHEVEICKLMLTHKEQIAGLSGIKLRDEIQEIKEGFEKDKQSAVNQAVAVVTARIANEVMELEQRLESTSMKSTEVKAELEMMTKRLKQFQSCKKFV